jgi:hypothetical protein
MATEQADGVTVTVMALRELLMQYFKGSCVQEMTTNSNARLYELGQNQRGLSRAERWRLSLKRPSILLLDNVPILSVGQEPDTVTMHVTVLNRSPQLKQVRKSLEKFLATYLPGVNVEESKGSVFYG